MPYPLVVIIHGGGWTVGDKRGELPSAAIPGFLALGFAVASINYRFAPEPSSRRSCSTSRQRSATCGRNAAAYGVDPDRFAAIGESAGAHLAALLGTTQDLPRVR